MAHSTKFKIAVLSDPSYTPNRLLAHLFERLGHTKAKQLAIHIGISAATLSRVVNRRDVICEKMIIAILDAMPEMTIAELRTLAGLPVMREK